MVFSTCSLRMNVHSKIVANIEPYNFLAELFKLSPDVAEKVLSFLQKEEVAFCANPTCLNITFSRKYRFCSIFCYLEEGIYQGTHCRYCHARVRKGKCECIWCYQCGSESCICEYVDKDGYTLCTIAKSSRRNNNPWPQFLTKQDKWAEHDCPENDWWFH